MANKTGGSAILRPSELFYNKLTPLLKERGIGLENRKEWPVQILKQVLAELMAETPKDLLAKLVSNTTFLLKQFLSFYLSSFRLFFLFVL